MKSGTEKIAIGLLTVFPLGLLLLAAVGWVMNVIKTIAALGMNELTTMFVARIVGVFIPPIGAVLGWF